jgi:hypothetical protein
MPLKTSVLILFFYWFNGTWAQSDTLQTINKFSTRQKLIVAGIAAQQIGSFYIEYNWWWKNNYHPFNLKNDGGFNNYSLGIDKVGHFYVSYFYYHAVYELMKYGHFSNKASNLTAILLPTTWALSIELGDGFSRYAFNPDDLLANFLGVAYGFAQTNIPALKPYSFKMSYYPSKRYIDNNFQNWSLSADYDGHIYWLTANLNEAAPNTFKSNFFKWFNFGAGYGVQGYGMNDFKPGYPMNRQFFIGLDYNLRAINTKKDGLKTLRNIVDKYHLPAPGLQINQDGNHQFKPFLLN